jgi:hypothetical protein
MGVNRSARRRPLPTDVEGVVDLQVALAVVVEELPKQEHIPLLSVKTLILLFATCHPVLNQARPRRFTLVLAE